MVIRHIIVDRDGVLNREPESGWVTQPQQWQWEAGALEAVVELSRAGMRLSVASNQSCIGRGVATSAEVDAVNAVLLADVARGGGEIGGIHVCPHAPEDGCGCRKPQPGLLLAAIEASGLPPAATLFIGDAVRDLEAGHAAEVDVALVRTGKGAAAAAASTVKPRWVFDDLGHAAACILGRRPFPL